MVYSVRACVRASDTDIEVKLLNKHTHIHYINFCTLTHMHTSSEWGDMYKYDVIMLTRDWQYSANDTCKCPRPTCALCH